MPTIVAVSDTHELHEALRISEMPAGDIFIHAGDFTNIGQEFAISDFGTWLHELPYKHKIVIAGNHDRMFERNPEKAVKILKGRCPEVIYLMDSGCEAGGLKIWGSPWSPEFMNWSFNVPRGKLHEKWVAIPYGLDILVTHGPPAGNLGGVLPDFKEDVGDGELRNAILEKRPKVHVCGHIHEGYGVREYDGMKFVNASFYTMSDKLDRNPIVFELP